GYITIHDDGNTFNGAAIQATLTLNPLDYGDPELKKTLHYVRIFGAYEGVTATLRMRTHFDYGHINVMQPETIYSFDLDSNNSIALYGTAVYGAATYGGGGVDFFEYVKIGRASCRERE